MAVEWSKAIRTAFCSERGELPATRLEAPKSRLVLGCPGTSLDLFHRVAVGRRGRTAPVRQRYPEPGAALAAPPLFPGAACLFDFRRADPPALPRTPVAGAKPDSVGDTAVEAHRPAVAVEPQVVAVGAAAVPLLEGE